MLATYHLQVASKVHRFVLIFSADTTPFVDVFKSYRAEGVGDVKADLQKVNEEYVEVTKGSLAMLALLERRSGVLKQCLNDGFTYEHDFVKAADKVEAAQDDAATIKVPEESSFRKSYPKLVPQNGGGRDGEHFGL
ncbi:MAG: hypothetical protein Q9181_000317 [Wetmoreana brouardii]